jgi:hypothetical protein
MPPHLTDRARRRRIAPIAVALALAAALGALAGSPALGASRKTTTTTATTTPPTPTPALARLAGQFRLTGRITVATNVRGEHVGEQVSRTWTFTPTCAAGACRTIGLVRSRAAGSDALTLRRRSRGVYTGAGSFYAPLRCGSRTYRRGSAVPFTITVRVTAAVLAGGQVFATQITASYTNSSRTNLTPCVAVLGHDAATYTGHIALPTAPTGGTGTGA